MRRALLTLLVLACAPVLLAHEMGSTRVNATFRHDGSYRIDITGDGRSRMDRLVLLRNIEVTFDGTRDTPHLQYVPVDQSGLVRLEGHIPQGARSFQWRYALPYTAYLLTVDDEAIAGGPQRQWVEGDAASVPFALGKRAVPLTRFQTALLYLRLGFTHIIPKGLDHILFVLGIFLLSTRWRPLLAQVTAFTIAHSVTLALTIYNVVSLPTRIVEPAIALSIAYVGLENVLTKSVKPWRIALVFCFGLLHGMGFAGVLADLGIPQTERATALVSFNVGVELGQLTVIAVAFAVLASWARRERWYRARVIVPASVMIGLVGLYWTVQRAM